MKRCKGEVDMAYLGMILGVLTTLAALAGVVVTIINLVRER